MVTTAVDGAREALEGAGAGSVVPIGDAEALGEAVAARLGDPSRAAAEGRRGRQRAEEVYPRTRWAGRVAALVTGLVGTSERQS